MSNKLGEFKDSLRFVNTLNGCQFFTNKLFNYSKVEFIHGGHVYCGTVTTVNNDDNGIIESIVINGIKVDYDDILCQLI